MAGIGDKINSLRFSRFETKRLAFALALSLAAHLLVWGGYEAGKKSGLWKRLHHAEQKLALARKKFLQPPAQNSEPITFISVDQASPDAPPDAKFYSSQNSRAANPDVSRESTVPKLNGKQTDVPKTQTAPRPQTAKPQAPQPQFQPSKSEPQDSQPAPLLQSGNETQARPQDSPKKFNLAPERPRTINQARAQQSQLAPGLQMQQEGGTPRRALVPAFDAKATPFGKYDAEFVRAVSQCWYDALDSHQFAQDRSGKVTLQFRLTYDGRITDMKVLENTVGEVLSLICQKAILDPAPYARWPSDMRQMVGEDFREMTFTFFYY
jgi:hypothetical protein